MGSSQSQNAIREEKNSSHYHQFLQEDEDAVAVTIYAKVSNTVRTKVAPQSTQVPPRSINSTTDTYNLDYFADLAPLEAFISKYAKNKAAVLREVSLGYVENRFGFPIDVVIAGIVTKINVDSFLVDFKTSTDQTPKNDVIYNNMINNKEIQDLQFTIPKERCGLVQNDSLLYEICSKVGQAELISLMKDGISPHLFFTDIKIVNGCFVLDCRSDITKKLCQWKVIPALKDKTQSLDCTIPENKVSILTCRVNESSDDKFFAFKIDKDAYCDAIKKLLKTTNLDRICPFGSEQFVGVKITLNQSAEDNIINNLMVSKTMGLKVENQVIKLCMFTLNIKLIY